MGWSLLAATTRHVSSPFSFWPTISPTFRRHMARTQNMGVFVSYAQERMVTLPRDIDRRPHPPFASPFIHRTQIIIGIYFYFYLLFLESPHILSVMTSSCLSLSRLLATL